MFWSGHHHLRRVLRPGQDMTAWERLDILGWRGCAGIMRRSCPRTMAMKTGLLTEVLADSVARIGAPDFWGAIRAGMMR
jgi:hypothetical protein